MFEKILISALRKVVSDTAFFEKKYTGTMYHGSVAPVTAWHINNMGQFGKGLYLALDRKWAEFHAEGGRQGKAGQRPSKEKGYVYEFQVSGNALFIKDEDEFFKELIGENEEAEDAFSRTGDLYSKAISRCTADYARDKGYDLVIFDPKNSDVLTPFPQAIVLNPKSFKLKNKPTVKADASSGTLTLWHGGNLEAGQENIAHKGGRWEHGPGLYLTTHYDTARKYSKGSRKLYKVVIRKGTNIRDVDLPLDAVQRFADTYFIKAKKKDVLSRIEKHINNLKVNADTFLNIVFNEQAIKNTDTDKLRSFLVQNGVDYSIVDNAFGWRERMIVLFNMKNIISKTVVRPKDKIEEYDLPTEFK
jgi:hypothetical protein